MLDKIPTIPSRPQTTADSFSLQCRRAGGDTPRLEYWGFDNETDPLTDVLLAAPDHLRHLATSSLSRKFLRERQESSENRHTMDYLQLEKVFPLSKE